MGTCARIHRAHKLLVWFSNQGATSGWRLDVALCYSVKDFGPFDLGSYACLRVNRSVNQASS